MRRLLTGRLVVWASGTQLASTDSMKCSMSWVALVALWAWSAQTFVAQAQPRITYGLDVIVYCPVGTHCDQPSEAALRRILEPAIDTVNTIWRPTGVSFRPTFQFYYDDRLSDIRIDGSQDAIDAVRIQELHDDAATRPDVVTLFLLPNLDYCFSGVPPLSGDSYGDDPADRHGVFCTPNGDGVTYAHELGHHFCLLHPHTLLDPAEPAFVGHDGDLLFDTPPDPAHVEILDHAPASGEAQPDIQVTAGHRGDTHTPPQNVIVAENEGHEWCDWDVWEAEAGSPLPRWCTPECWGVRNGVRERANYSPRTELVMSYYKHECTGPYVVDGRRTEAWSDQQIQRIGRCRTELPERAALPDACAGRGGDGDGDGLCGIEDPCPRHASRVDDDGDGIPNPCDLCPNDSRPESTDTDLDGLGDVCDPDDDNDGCNDDVDEHPKQSTLPVGTTRRPNCPDPITETFAWEGLNSDNDPDGILDCETNDNDGDGTVDDLDDCPNTPEPTCVTEAPACVPNWAEVCFGPECNLFSFHVFDRINPADSIAFDRFQIVDGRIYLGALPDRTVFESGLVFEGNLLAAEPSQDLTIGMEIRSMETGERVATVGEYQATSLTNQGLGFGNSLILTLDAEGAPTVASTWGSGIQLELTLADLDGDETPNIGDNCIEIANPQIDADEDGFGNRCDPDLDGDGMVTETDVDWVRDCEGTDVTISILTRCEDQPAESTPPETIAALRRCKAADLDTDGLVGASDTEIALQWLGREPGPSATALVTTSSGGGGCGCHAPGRARAGGSSMVLGLLGLLAFIWMERRRHGRPKI